MTLLKTGLLATLSLALAGSAMAQQKQFTIAEATNGIATMLAPQSVKQPSWEPGTHKFYWVADNNWRTFDADKKDTGHVFSEPMKTSFQYKWLGNDFYYAQDDTVVHFRNGARLLDRPISKDAANLTVFSNYGMAYTVANNLFYYQNTPAAGKISARVTNDTDKNIINGQAVHRNEFGIDNGIFFSPKGTLLAYYHMDQRMVADYPVIDWSVTPAVNTNVKYPMAGGTSHQVTVRVFNPATGNTVTLKTGEPKDQYLTDVTWSPDERYIFIAVLNRGQNHLWLNEYDVATGNLVKTLFEETDDKYVEPQHALSFLPGSNDQFIWWSQRDGYMHLYLCNTDGKVVKQLTKGDWIVNEIIGFNAKRSEVLITTSKEDPREKHGYAVNWKTGVMRRLDSEAGTHNYTASDDGEYLYDVLTATNVPKRSMIRSVDGKIVKVLVDAADSLASYQRPQMRSITLKAEDGTPLYGKLILPTNFDSTKKYPVVVYLYNGPHVQLVKNGFPESGNLWYEYMAQHGYIVWTMDGRGSSNRGLKFEQATFRRLGTVEMEDQLRGVDYLKSLSYVDANRLGVHGWSFGGFMTTSLMLRHPGVFKCAVAGGPVMDWSMYEIMYGGAVHGYTTGKP